MVLCKLYPSDPRYILTKNTLYLYFVGLDDPETVLVPLVSHLRPLLVNSLKDRRKAAFTQSAQSIKRVLDNLQKKVDEVVFNNCTSLTIFPLILSLDEMKSSFSFSLTPKKCG